MPRTGKHFLHKVEAECGLRFRVLSGKDEARLSFMGSLLPGMDPSHYAVVDVGGGSTEFVTAKRGSKCGFRVCTFYGKIS